MPVKIIDCPVFTVAGISVRTTNDAEISGQGLIPKMWARFMQENILAAIPDKSDSDILALYTEYQSDARGPYTFMIGARVNSANALPPGISAIKIPAGRYAVFLTEKGFVGKVVPQAWQRIWSQTEDSPAANRAFQADFEVYGQRAADPQNAQVEIYVGIGSGGM